MSMTLTWTQKDPTGNSLPATNTFYAVLDQDATGIEWVQIELTTIHNPGPNMPALWAVYTGTTKGLSKKVLREEGGVLTHRGTNPSLDEAEKMANTAALAGN